MRGGLWLASVTGTSACPGQSGIRSIAP